MTIIVDGQAIVAPSSVADFIRTYPQYQISSRQLRSMPCIAVEPNEDYIFVHQLEAAVVSASDPNIKMIGIDDMTTCCCVVIRHSGSAAMAAGHFDGNDTRDGLARMINGVHALTREWARQHSISELELNTQHQYELYMIGGFEDARNISLDVVMQLFENLCMSDTELHLKAACIVTNNTYYQDNIPYPCITGLICDVKSGGLSPASFTFQGPLEEIRRLRFATLPPIIMHSIYNPFTRILEIKPYDWTITDDTIQQLLGLNTNSFLHYWSTSPLAEKPTFVPACKTALKFLKDNRSSLFCSGRSYKFIRTNGQWKLVE
jgi:hypothetical protein